MKKINYSGRINIWSNGGGVQSAAIAVLIRKGVLPRPDLAVISDTEREASTTWDYLDNYIQPMLDEIDLKIHRVKKSDYAKDDIYIKDNILMPMFSTFYDRQGKRPGYCSDKWKKIVIERFCREQFSESNKFNMWIGISTDELKRVKVTLGKWQRLYPLINLLMSRSDCIKLVTSYGLPAPPRSSCYMCPNRSDQEWKMLKDNCPDDFKKAVALEKEIRLDKDYLYFSKEYKTLEKAKFGNSDQGDMFGTCDSGLCHT